MKIRLLISCLLIFLINMISKDYLYTKVWEDLSTVTLESDALYLYAQDPEDRSQHCSSNLSINNPNTLFEEITINNFDQMVVSSNNFIVPLSSTDAISRFFSSYDFRVLYLEVTGMSCRLVAPLMKYAILNGIETRVVYSEPKEYLLKEFQKEGLHHDLSESVAGVNPLPGFIHLVPFKEEPLFVTFLGFEGGRFTYLVMNKQPSYDKILPIVGVPGYRVHYPFESFWGNRNALKTTKSYEHVLYAEANSVVDSFLVLNRISYDKREPNMIVAPIGTKPHAIGAILYAIKNPNRVELLYDNPRRSLHRTEGVGRILVCNVTKLFSEN